VIEVYRVEHKETGIGPFQTNHIFTQKLAQRLVKNKGYFPNPGDDGLGLASIPWFYNFGCPSIDDIKRWVLLGVNVQENDFIIKTLDELGFCLNHYLVEKDRVIIGWKKIQLAFDTRQGDDCCIVETQSLNILMRESPLVFDIIT